MSSPGAAAARPRGRDRRPRASRWLFATILIAATAAGGWFLFTGKGAARTQEPTREPSSSAAAEAPIADVVRPRKGGIERVTVQPGSVHAFESVDLYAMVSGYLRVQSADIGSRVKSGQVLAEIDVPRERNAVGEAEATLEQAKAQAKQAEARVKAAEADRETAAAALAQTEADVDKFVANRRLAEAQYARIADLHQRKAVPKKLLDEQQRDLDSAVAAEKTARLAVRTAKARTLGSAAKVDQAQADLAEARAAVGVAESRLAKARVDLGYSRIVAPFDGVVTRRSFHPGAFIRAASDGSQPPLLSVARTDLMRVVVRVPDRDVVLANAGDPVELTIDALGGRPFRGVVSRIAESQDPNSRTMRVEVDLPNPDGLLREGMYGRARIALEPGSQRLTVPAACVLDRSGKGQGTVLLVRDGKVRRQKVELGAENGSVVEIASGLGQDDQVVLKSSTPLVQGMPVVAKTAG